MLVRINGLQNNDCRCLSGAANLKNKREARSTVGVLLANEIIMALGGVVRFMMPFFYQIPHHYPD